jgi:hypothetical protein
MKRRAPAAGTPDLGAATAAILLGGWSVEGPPPGVPREPHGFDHGFLELYDIGGVARLWRANETALRARAAEWGWAPAFMLDGVPMYYGEFLAAGGQER